MRIGDGVLPAFAHMTTTTPMQPIARFALESHAGPYEDWPLTSRLIVDGVPVEPRVPGYVIDAQYDTPFGTLLVTSFDCLFEESNCFLLLDETLRIVAKKELAAPYGSWLLDAHWPETSGALVLHYQVGVFFRLDVLPPRRWWPRRPRLRLTRVAQWRSDARMHAAHAALEAQLRALARIHADSEARPDRRAP